MGKTDRQLPWPDRGQKQRYRARCGELSILTKVMHSPLVKHSVKGAVAMSYQKLVIVGNLGRDPELQHLPSGQAVCSLSVAANRRWSDRSTGEPQEEVCWFRVSVWGKQAEAANQHLSKGRQVLIEGRLRPDPETGGPRVYTRNDGTAGASFEVVADRVQFLGGNGGNGNGGSTHDNGQAAAEPAYTDDQIPF